MLNAETRSRNLNIRIAAKERELIGRAAAAQRQTVSEFVMSAARRAAEEVLLDRRLFHLDEETYEAFVRALDAPTERNARLAQLLDRKPRWQT